MRYGLAFLLLALSSVYAQEAVFSDYVVGTAEGSQAVVTFYLQNVSPCFLGTVTVRVAYDTTGQTSVGAKLVANLPPGEVGTFAVGLDQPVAEGWAWTVDSVSLRKTDAACAQEGSVDFAKANFGDAAATVATEAVSAEGTTYTVQAGDSMWRVAQTFGTTVEAIMQANGLTDTVLSVGETLQIPGQVSGAESQTSVSSTLHTVEGGDTLWGLAQRYNTTPELIQAANCLDESSVLSVGNQLRLPPAGADEASLRQSCP